MLCIQKVCIENVLQTNSFALKMFAVKILHSNCCIQKICDGITLNPILKQDECTLDTFTIGDPNIGPH